MKKRTLVKIEKWINKNICDIELIFDNAFYYLDDENIIAIEKNYSGIGDKYFIEILKKLGLKKEYNGFILSLLHEIGHSQTLDTISNKAYDKYNAKLDKIYNAGLSDKKFYKAYYNVKSEKIANQWLVKYANTHEKELKQLQVILDKQ